MKHFFLFCGLGLLAFAHPAGATTAPADTVAGHAQLVRKLSQALCTRLTTDHTIQFAGLTSAQAMQLTQQLFTEAMQRDSAAVLALMKKGAQQNLPPQQVGQQLGKDVVITLGHNCPAALPLITRLVQTEQGQQTLAAQQALAMSAAEKKVLQPIAAALCTQLALGDAKVRFASLSPSQRQQALTAALQKAFKQHTPQLLKYYGEAQLDKKLRSGEIDNKIGMLAPSQGGCAQYIMLLKAPKPAKP
jgi:ABC-type transporter MlaC component